MTQQEETEIPKGWERTLVGSFLKLKNGYAFKSADYVEAGEDTVPVIRISDVKVDGANSDKANHVPACKAVEGFEIEKGDQLIAMSGATTGKVGVYQGITPAYQNQRVGNLKLISDENFNKQFKNYLIKAKSQAILDVAYGGAQPNVSARGIEEIEVLIPPLPEQKRIVEKLDSLLAQVDTIQQRLNNLPDIIKRFRQSVLAAAVSGKLTEQWREFKEVKIEKDVSIEELCANSFYGPRFSKDDYSDDGIPTIRTTDMTKNGGIKITASTPRIVVPEQKMELFGIRKDDLLITRTGSIGTMAIFKGDYPAIPSAYLIRFRFNERVKVQFLYMFLTSPLGLEQMGLGTTAITQPNINAKSIKSIKLDLPCIEEQTEIVRLVEQYFALADTLEKNLANAKQRVDNLTQSILAKAFRGELVPQDPNDEPADKLLARIKAARLEAEKLEKVAKKAAKASKK